LRCVVEMLAWQPELLGAARENHIVRSTSVVQNVVYEKGRVAYRTFDAATPCEDVLRLAFVPKTVLAEGKPLAERQQLAAGSYTVKRLSNGDCLLTIRHDGCRDVVVEGDDPQQQAAPGDIVEFDGNQVRLLGDVGPDGGKADVYLDGVRQACGIDFWCPQARRRQVVWYKNGLPQGRHTLKTVALGTKNPRSAGTGVRLSGVQWSDAEGTSGFGEGRGPKEPQRVIFGYVGRKDYCDSRQQPWRPATEFILRLHKKADLVPISFWTEPQLTDVAGTKDPELYRYGVFGRDFTAYFTVAPSESYFVRLKFCQARSPRGPGGYATNVDLQGKTVVTDMDIAATAGATAKAVDLVFNDVRPVHGIIAVRFWHRYSGQAMVQAIEVGPGRCPAGARPVTCVFPTGMNLLIDPGFEEGVPGIKEQRSKKQELDNASGWSYRFLSTAPAAAWPKPDAAPERQPAPFRSRSGDDALCTHAKAGPAHIQVFQDVRVLPQTGYRASVWVQAADVHGKGFGTSPTDSAGLILAELDAAGQVLVTHSKISVTKACDYTELSGQIVTHQRAAAVRFLLDTQIGCPWDEGYVAYDDSSFVQQAADKKP